MNVHDVLCNSLCAESLRIYVLTTVACEELAYPVSLFVVLVLDNKYHIETGQDSCLEIDILKRALRVGIDTQ